MPEITVDSHEYRDRSYDCGTRRADEALEKAVRRLVKHNETFPQSCGDQIRFIETLQTVIEAAGAIGHACGRVKGVFIIE